MSIAACPGIPDNPDITGLGVRLAFYIQAYITVILANLPGADVNGSYWAMTMTAVALFISALVLSGSQNLSLFHAILISVLLFLHSYAAAFSMWAASPFGVNRAPESVKTPREMERHVWKFQYKSVPVFLIATTFTGYIWIKAPSFGTPSVCNPETLFVILGKKLSAVHGGRISALILIGIHGVFLFLFLVSGLAFFIWDHFASPSRTIVPAYLFPLTSESQRKLNPNLEEYVHIPLRENTFAIEKVFRSRRRRKPREERNYVSQLRIGMITIWSGILVIFVLLIELTIKDNVSLILDPNDSTWTLGQVFPVVMLAVPCIAILQWSLEHHSVGEAVSSDAHHVNHNGEGSQTAVAPHESFSYRDQGVGTEEDTP
ncbi:hypothetical protein SISSUDRAFT_1047729 [Sistotremastrum suecicum HHB10207 ss-3]|uniref:Uncharacterized protein n=1 Tax=Sistotremastrum suecicum HHB10207 ss-3 TaxID=1314776 RepID=A0A166CZY7_9AGAM|nr:hypothetical protein SISSUDRAFT_1047729 [Sistotremastrum suecicum HHB10207 ss-3]